MERKQLIEQEIEEHLAKIKQLRADLEEEEHNLQVCYNVLNLLETKN